MDLSEHRQHFDTFGFAVLRRFADVDALSAEFDACMSDAFADPSHTNSGSAGNEFRYVPTMCERTPNSLALMRQLAPVASAILHAPVLPSRAKATRYRGSTKWHRDLDSSLRTVSFLFYLQPVVAESGALRVLPGSHFAAYAGAIQQYVTMTGAVPGTAIPTLPGDAIALDERLFHASSGGLERRQWRVDFVADLPGTDQALRDYFAGQYAPGWNGGYDVDRYPSYGEHWRSLDASWSRRLDELGAFQAAADEEAHARAMRATS
jgi:ectoine hydroxylase-related dioxygenase (phytanoyl-CoA dioxygenase family)